MIRLLCVEDDALVRTSIQQRLAVEPDLQVVALVPDARAALAHLSAEEIDVILLDYQLEGADGLRFMELMTQWYGWPHATGARPFVLFYTGFADPEFEARARGLGASGVVAKAGRSADLVTAVRTVAHGGTWFASEEAAQ